MSAQNVTAASWKSVDIGGGVEFKVPSNLEFIKKVGSGAYGSVAAFRDPGTLREVAVKKISNAFEDLVDGKRILREVRLLRNVRHDNQHSPTSGPVPTGSPRF